jgi:HK97 family phage major capsid protein
MAALMIAVAGMPLDIYAYNQQQIGTGHAAPWLRKTATAICDAAKGLFDTVCAAMRAPQFWRIAVPAAAMVLLATGYLDATGSVVLMAGTTIQELLDKKKGFVDAATEIRDRVYAQQAGEWRGDDTQKFDDLMAKAEACTAEIDRAAKLDAASRSLTSAEQPANRQAPVAPPNGQRAAARGVATLEDRRLALQGWVMRCNASTAGLVTERHLEAARRCGVSLDQKNLNIRLASEPLVSTRADEIRAWEQRIVQVDTVSPDGGGHYTVPDEMMRPLEVALLAHGGMRQVSQVIRTNTGADLPMPTLNDTTNAGALLGETLEHTELDLDFNQLVLNAYKYTSRRVAMSVEYLQDNAINAASRIGSILGERIARITNQHFTTGTGNAQPKGIVVAATSSGITTASATAITYDEIVDLKHSVDPAYRAQGARFMFKDSVLKILKKIKVAQYSGDTGGWPLWRAGLAAGDPDTIDGDPYTINQDMAAPTSTQKAMLYGLLSKYIIRDVRDITLVRLDERYAELGVVAFLAFSRHDGDLLDAGTHPVKYLTMNT